MSGRVQCISYILAVGPPMSLMVPLNDGALASVEISLRTESCDRD